MADAFLEWGGDLDLTPDGDLRLVEGPDETRQSIERRLFTAVRGYLWAPEYGAGLPQRIGRVARTNNIRALVRSQIALEASVARVPVPKVSVTVPDINPGLYVIEIEYADALTGVAVAIRLQVPGSA